MMVRKRMPTVLTALAVVLVLILAGNGLAAAATGKSFILGKSNSASKVTKLKRTSPGPALDIRTKRSSDAPLVVNGQGRVARLNADLVDGKHASSFASASGLAQVKSTVAAQGAMTPIAIGVVQADGTFPANRSIGVTSTTWDAGNSWYSVNLTGISYFYSNYHTTITPLCQNVHYSTDSSGGKLIVKFFNNSGTKVQCGFTFATVDLQ